MLKKSPFVLCTLVLATTCVKASELPIKGLAHVAFQSTSLERARVFYTGFLGFEYTFPVLEKHQSWYLKVNDRQFVKLVLDGSDNNYVLSGVKKNEDYLVEIALQVTDAKKTFKVLKDKGLKPTAVKKRLDGTLATTIKDPDNHTIAFIEYTKNSLQSKSKGKNLGARRIAKHMWRASFAVTNESKSKHFYHDLLGFSEEWHGVWPYDHSSKSGYFKLPGTQGDLLEYVVVKKDATADEKAAMQHATYEAKDVFAANHATGTFGRPQLKKYAMHTDGLGRPFFNLYDTDNVRVEITQKTPSPLKSK